MLKKIQTTCTALGGTALLLCSLAQANDHKPKGYEVWASDQSNSVADAGARGVRGSLLWIWDSEDVRKQIHEGTEAKPLPCMPGKDVGPCDLLDVFPQALEEIDAQGNPTGNTLGDLSGFGRLHGMLSDPQQRYLNVNIFAPSGGYIGVIDIERKEAVGLFRVTGAERDSATFRSVHMSLWNQDGSAILIANLHGKLLERIDVVRNGSGKIKDLIFNRAASLSVGKGQIPAISATAFRGKNARGKMLVGKVAGNYSEAAFSDLTPNGFCKENGCTAGNDGTSGGRPNNVIICPITSLNQKTYVTLGGGGLFVVDSEATPMKIVGEYGQQVVNGAGCGGVQKDNQMWLNAGVSASGAGASQSTFTIYRFDDLAFGTEANPENIPAPELIFKDTGNTTTIGNSDGIGPVDTSGQIPGITTRRDAHGMAVTENGSHVHTVDRIQNVVEVFSTDSLTRTTYDLTSEDGQGSGTGACASLGVTDDAALPANDPAPDLLESSPDGKHLMIAFRGPVPVSVTHSAQGSCPGVGVVELLDGGAHGKLVTVLRTSNTVDNAAVAAPGGHAYTGTEHSDIHAVAVVKKLQGKCN